MSLAHVFGQDLSQHCASNCAPIVFVVDNDSSVRESLDQLICAEGWHAETFESVEEFLARPRPLVPSCLVLDASLPGVNTLDHQKRIAVEERLPSGFRDANSEWGVKNPLVGAAHQSTALSNPHEVYLVELARWQRCALSTARLPLTNTT